jgi:hypothetical protein
MQFVSLASICYREAKANTRSKPCPVSEAQGDSLPACTVANLARSFYSLRCTPPSPCKAVTICPDHAATSSSRNVRSADWNVARSKME